MDTKKMALIFFGLSVLCGKATFAMEKEKKTGEEKCVFSVLYKSEKNTFSQQIANGYSIVVFINDPGSTHANKLIDNLREVLSENVDKYKTGTQTQLISVVYCDKNLPILKKHCPCPSDPTYLIFKDGKVIKNCVGYFMKSDIKKSFSSAIRIKKEDKTNL